MNPSDKALVLDQHGRCQLISADGNMATVLVKSAGSREFILYADLMQLPDETTSTIYENLLALNLPGSKTAGGMLGFASKSRSLVFSHSYEIDSIDAFLFHAEVENFFEAAEQTRKIVKTVFQKNSALVQPRRKASCSLLRSFHQLPI